MRWLAALTTLLAVALLLWLAISRLELDSDIVAGLPFDDPVVADARYVIERHPVLDRILFDLSLDQAEPDRPALVAAGSRLQEKIMASGLFKSVGMQEVAAAFPRLMSLTVENLPLLFGRQELRQEVAALLGPGPIKKRLEALMTQLSGFSGIGQSEWMAKDPLQLRHLVLARLSSLLPSADGEFAGGQIISTDGRHLLLIADPKAASTDGQVARKLDRAIGEIVKAFSAESELAGRAFRLITVGGYRAALDNESIARADTGRTIVLVSVCLALLLLLCFPRPWLGLLSLVPALAGTVMALFLYSLLLPSISLLALGFGGAIVSITVDHGIAYLLFMDRDRRTKGRDASREVWSVGLLATLTTTGAFLALLLSGFPILGQLGLFAALGVLSSFVFVHTVFPWIIPVLAPAKREGWLPVASLASRLARAGGKTAAVIAVVFALGMSLFARPEFRTDLRAMNTVRAETLADENLVQEVWGKVLDRVYLLIEGKSLSDLQERADHLSEFLAAQVSKDQLASGFSPAHILPGERQARQNLAHWRAFWTPARVAATRSDLERAAQETGFAAGAFDPFLAALENPSVSFARISEQLAPLLGIMADKSGAGYLALYPVQPGPGYQAEEFYAQASALSGVRVLDPGLFADRLSGMVVTTFTRMLMICGIGLLVLLLLFFLELTLPLLVLAPVVFALVCTLASLKLIGHPLDIPGLLLAIVVMGMGIDYSLFFVRSHQRYLDEQHSSFATIRAAVLLASTSTLIGFGSLALADHALLSSAGLTSFLAIGYSMLGTFVLLPPLLAKVFAEVAPPQRTTAVKPGSASHHRRVRRRYRHLEAYPRQFARFKLMLDPMFPALAKHVGDARVVIDVGCGYGIAGAWLRELFPRMIIHGFDPDPERIRIARRVLGTGGVIGQAAAPNFPAEPARADVALMLDMAHYLSDEQLATTLGELRKRLLPAGRLVVRLTVASGKKFPWERMLERVRVKFNSMDLFFRSREQVQALLVAAGFELELTEASAPGREETWFVGRVSK